MQKQVIKFKNRSPYPNSIFIGNEDDNLARRVQFVLPSEIDGAKIYLHLSIGEYSDVIELDDSLIYVPTRTHTQYPGNWTGYLEAHSDNDTVWHSNTFTFKIGDLPDSGEQIEQAYPSAIESALNEIRSLSQETELNARQVSQDKQNVELNAQQVSQDKQNVELNAQQVSQDKQNVELNAQQVSQDKQNVEHQIANINIEFNELKDDLTDINERLFIHNPESNYIDVSKNTSGGYIGHSNGEVIQNNGFAYTDYVELSENTPYYYGNLYAGYYAFYDENKVFIAGEKELGDLTDGFTIPIGAKYGRFTINLSWVAIDSSWISTNNQKPKDYEIILSADNAKSVSKNQGSENSGKILSVSENGDVVAIDSTGIDSKTYKKNNLLVKDTMTKGYINNSGNVVPYNTLWCSDYMEIEQGKLYINISILYNRYFAFYDESKNVVSTYENDVFKKYTDNIYVIDVPVGAKYFRCTSYTNGGFVGNSAEFTNENEIRSVEKLYPYTLNPDNPCDYQDLTVGVFNKCVCIGDSLTYGTFNMDDGASYGSVTSPQELANKFSYPSQFKKITGVDTLNLGVAGETSVSWYNSHSNYDYSGCDMAIIHLGVNDSAFSVSDDDTKTALTNIINSLKTSVKNIKIYLCTIIPAYSNTEHTGYMHKSEVIRELYNESYANDNNVVLLDLEQYSHAKPYTSYTAGHLSALGYYVLARDLARYISWHIDNNLRDYRFIQFIGNDGVYNGD